MIRALCLLLTCSAGPAWAQADSVAAPALQARPAQTTTPIIAPDPAAYPRDIEHGGSIFEFSYAGPDRRVAEREGQSLSLDAYELDADTPLFCGSDVSGDAVADDKRNALTACYRDADGDGAAELRYGVSAAAGGAITLNAPETLATPLAWSAAPARPVEVAILYGGPTGGFVGEDGALRDAIVEVIIVRRAETGEWRKASPAERPIMLPCFEDGRCFPYPAPTGYVFALSAPTVEGKVHVDLLDPLRAALLARELQPLLRARIERETGQTLPPPPPSPAT
ncbi:MAG: hypothetical protein GC189_09480 [Alphaproteobacteria bacterium]|nr:hypothetical protein [Alphaproteobacteria bacterium]